MSIIVTDDGFAVDNWEGIFVTPEALPNASGIGLDLTSLSPMGAAFRLRAHCGGQAIWAG